MSKTRIVLPIEGMTCASCAATVQEALAGAVGVASAGVNFATNKAAIEYDGAQTNVAQLIKTVRDAGYNCGKASVTFGIIDLHYAPSVTPLEQSLSRVNGVIRAVANQATEMVTVDYIPGVVNAEDLERAVAAASFEVAAPIAAEDPLERERIARGREMRTLTWKFAVAAVVAIISMVGAMLLMADRPMGEGGTMKQIDLMGRLLMPAAIGLRDWVAGQGWVLELDWITWGLAVITLPVVVWSGQQFFKGTWSGFRHRTADMNTLIGVGTAAAYLYSLVATAAPTLFLRAGLPADVYYEAVSGIIALVLLGRLLEAGAKGRTSEAIRRLATLRAKVAHVIRDREEVEIPVEAVVVGDMVIVKPGEKVPVDGIVTDGASAVNEAMLTGEPMPAAKKPGDEVIGGTLNTTGSITFRATRVGKETALGQIVQLVEDAQATKAPIQKLADRVAGVFVPIVIALALIAFVAWFDVGPVPQVRALVYAMAAFVTVLIIACPCALGLATPTAILVGTGKAAEYGILIRSGEALERLANTRRVLLDKTGTITEGKPTVTHIVTAKKPDGTPISPADVLKWAASVEQRSEHPLAVAILKAARDKQVSLLPVEKFAAMEGRGVRGTVDWRIIEVISLRRQPVAVRAERAELEAALADGDRLAAQGRSPVIVVVNNTVYAVIAISDPIKPTSRAAIELLKKRGIPVTMVSGDSRKGAQAVANEVGIEETIAEVLPSQKADLVKKLQRQAGGGVVMVGDGINDAPALAQADVGIAIGTGSDIAMEASDVTLIRGDLRAVFTAIELSRRTLRTIRWNLIWAFGYNVLLIPVAAGALYPVTGWLLSPVLASAAMAWSSLSVVLNSLTLRSFKPRGAASHALLPQN